jgi:general stress protein 26
MGSMQSTVKLSGQQRLRSFLHEAKAATLAVPINDAGTIHAASLLYVHDDDPLKFYFISSKSTEKYTLLHKKSSIPAALVIGTEKGTPFTVQLHGLLESVDPAENADVLEKYYEKRGNRGDDITDPNNSLLLFTPNWGRFTDYANGYDQYLLDLT